LLNGGSIRFVFAFYQTSINKLFKNFIKKHYLFV
jgi:hypothetical protein